MVKIQAMVTVIRISNDSKNKMKAIGESDNFYRLLLSFEKISKNICLMRFLHSFFESKTTFLSTLIIELKHNFWRLLNSMFYSLDSIRILKTR